MMKAGDARVLRLMSTPVVSLDPMTNVAEVLRTADNLDIHHFPLVDASGLYGVVCTCDLEAARPEQPVSQFAHRQPVTVPPDAKAHEAAARMMLHGVGSVLIADHEGVWGILTREDLAQAVPELMQAVRCQSCESRRHLRRGPGHTLICPECRARGLASDGG